MILPLISLLVLGPAQKPTAIDVQTNRYALSVESTADEAATLGRILETAWPTFREFFHAEPPLHEGARLVLRVYASREACIDAAMRDDADMPPEQEPAWFAAKTGTAYVCRGSTDWTTRYLVLYGACLQFHRLAKPKNRDLDEWYSHGIAESFAVHAFDGVRLVLGTSPVVSSIDHAARAMEKLGGRMLGLDPFTDEKVRDPSVRWAVVRFATSSAAGKHRARLEKLALGTGGSRVSGQDFMRSLGREKDIAAEFTAWLLVAQAPLELITLDWETLPGDRIVGRSIRGELSICLAKPRYRSLEVVVETPSDEDAGTPGIVFGYRDDRNYVLAKFRPPVLFLEHVVDGRQREGDTLAMKTPGTSHLAKITSQGSRAVLEVDGTTYPPLEVGEGRIGLVSIAGASTFRGVICR